MRPLDTAIFWIEYIHRHGKDALRSPILDMPWWQASLLDVYGFILILISFIVCVIILVFKKLLFLFQVRRNLKIKVN